MDSKAKKHFLKKVLSLLGNECFKETISNIEIFVGMRNIFQFLIADA